MIKKKKIAILSPLVESYHAQVVKGFRSQIKPEDNISQQVIFSRGPHMQHMCEIAEGVVSSNEYDLVVTVGALFSHIFAKIKQRRESKVIHIFTGTGDPEGLGIIESSENPGEGISGVEMSNVEPLIPIYNIIKIVKNLKQVLIPYYPPGRSGALEKTIRKASILLKKNGIKVITYPIYSGDDIRAIPKKFFEESDLLIWLEGCLTGEEITFLIQQASIYQIILSASGLQCSQHGAGISYGALVQDIGVEAAKIAKKYLLEPQEKIAKPHPIIHIKDTGQVIINRVALRSQGGELTEFAEEAIKQGSFECENFIIPISDIKT